MVREFHLGKMRYKLELKHEQLLTNYRGEEKFKEVNSKAEPEKNK